LIVKTHPYKLVSVVISFYSQAAAHIENTNVIWHTVNYKYLAKEICHWAFWKQLTNLFALLLVPIKITETVSNAV
jgi:hypothetical protein